MTTPGILPPNPIDWRNLIQAGRDLLNQQFTGHTLTREHARRAISIAYYSLFHALAESNAASLIGTLTDAASAAAWSRVYRGLDHSTARRELQRQRHEFSEPARNFADTFDRLQRLRHSADYDHNAAVSIDQASVALDQAEAAILDYLQTPVSERVYIATITLIRPR